MVPPTSAPLIVSFVELSFVVFLQSIWLHVPLLALPLPLLALSMVPFYPSSFFVPLDLCSPIPSSLLTLRLFLPQFNSSF
jgi:hypothetical protein